MRITPSIALILLLAPSSCAPRREAGKDEPSNERTAPAPAPPADARIDDAAPAQPITKPRISAVERYRQESRDQAFAVAREELYASVFPVLQKRLKGLTLHASCKQTTCKIIARIPTELALDPSLPEVQLPWGDRVSVSFDSSDPTHVIVQLYAAFEGPMSDLEHHRAVLERAASQP